MSYTKLFDPKEVNLIPSRSRKEAQASSGDRRDGLVYVYTDEIILAVNIAMATNRPLLVRGASGSGKSSLARNVAEHLGWRYYEEVISSRLQARDLLWRFDAVRRFNDAQVKKEDFNPSLAPYIQPGVLWWAFDRVGARRRGMSREETRDYPVNEPEVSCKHPRAVVLLDEIDKADPDVPNNLLVPLGSLQFVVEDLGLPVKATYPPLVFITTNEERQLPAAFLRRCVVLELKLPKSQEDYKKYLVKIASAHYGAEHLALFERLSAIIVNQAQSSGSASPSTAEFLDAVQTCLKLAVDPDSPDWAMIERITLAKPRGPFGTT